MAKLPTRSPTHEDVPMGRLSSMGLEIEDIADGNQVALRALIELAEDRGRPVSHYLAAIPLATELSLAADAPLTVRVCAGTCQRWGALDLLDHLVDRLAGRGGPGAATAGFAIVPVSCLDRCDLAPACEVHGAHGQLVIAPATRTALDEALATLGT
ncbi:MAG TPA: (2Fe-2S) ferredoxin domain-containing protein [Kofleriaceae bacterium]|nr:(2Fe-2S) ferredoxin domain-containing protein [Kofleriaceae bacterium]